MAKIVIPYTPRKQLAHIHNALEESRFAVLVLHRRAGKTVLSINQLIMDVLTCPLPDPRGAYIAPLYSQAKRVAWDYVKHYCSTLPGVKFNESELRADLPGGGRIYLCGADNPDSLRGMYFDSVVLDEVAQMAPRAWSEVIRPALADRRGRAIFIGTPQGKSNAFYQFFEDAQGQKDWYRELLTAEDTGIIHPEELKAAEAEMSRDEFAQEFFCSWEAAVRGAFYAHELNEARKQDRITRVPHNPRYEVFTAWDLGLADATAIWFCQNIRGELRFIDYREWTNVSLLDIISEVRSLPYMYGVHFAPHDIKQREYTHGQTRIQIAQDAGISFLVTKKIPINDGIEAGRVMLRRSYIDKEGCASGLAALEQYRMQWDDKRQAFHKHPLHDWTCLAGETKVLTHNGMCRIMDLPKTGEVKTLCGLKKYENPRITKRDARLVEVAFRDGHTARCTPDHLFLTESGWRYARDLEKDTLILSSLTRSPNILTEAYTVYGQVTDIMREAVRDCTEMHGQMLSGKYLQDAISTIRTIIQPIMCSPTWSAYQRTITYPLAGTNTNAARLNTFLLKQGKELPSGINLKRDDSGIGEMLRELRAGLNGEESLNRASTAARWLTWWLRKVGIHRNIVPTTARPLLIDHVTEVRERQDVWCLTVPSVGHFCLENGAVVHNSHSADAWRYMAINFDNMIRPTISSQKHRVLRELTS